MGSTLSKAVFQPLILIAAAALMVIALVYQKKACASGNDKYGEDIFKINVIMGSSLVVIAVLITFLTALLSD